MRTDELLSLQKRQCDLACGDELQFQVVHQVAELWMKVCAHELDRVIRSLEMRELNRARRLLDRVGQIQQLLIQQMSLLDSMNPIDYLTIRSGLGRGSGQESPGFRKLMQAPSHLWPALEAVLEDEELTPIEVYRAPNRYPEIFDLLEALIGFDQNLQAWRMRHLLLVYRQIGPGTESLKRKSSDLLAETMLHRFFPALWEVRTALFAPAGEATPVAQTGGCPMRTAKTG